MFMTNKEILRERIAEFESLEEELEFLLLARTTAKSLKQQLSACYRISSDMRDVHIEELDQLIEDELAPAIRIVESEMNQVEIDNE